MLKLYTTLDYFKDNEIIKVNDDVFYWNYKSYVFSKQAKEYIRKYDGKLEAALIADGARTMISKYGDEILLTELSTGLKTLLNLMHAKPPIKAVDVTECGENILLDIFHEAAEREISIVLRHTELPEFSHISVSVNDKKVASDDTTLYILLTEEGL